MSKIINVTRAIYPTMLPYLFKHIKLLRSYWYTNDGRYVRELENNLCKLWGVKNVVLMSNGTLPLIFLMNQIPSNSKVITTPFSFVATTSSIVSTGNFPLFVDLAPKTLSIDTASLDEIIAKNNPSCVLLTFVYGLMPDMDVIKHLSKKYQIPFYFDASHSFGVEKDGVSALSHGSASTISFHITKIFSTIEGGALVTNNDELANKARSWRNFGIHEGKITDLGINGKMSEFHALFGIQSLKHVGREILRRRNLLEKYKQQFNESEIEVVDSPNASYAPIIFESEQKLLRAQAILIQNGIIPRRYFYPSLDTLDFLPLISKSVCPNSRDISERILCLPIGKDVSSRKAIRIAHFVLKSVDNAKY